MNTMVFWILACPSRSIDEQSNHEIVHALRLGEANCAAYKPLDPGLQIDMFALDFLRVLLAHLMLVGIKVPLVGPPAVCVKLLAQFLAVCRRSKRSKHGTNSPRLALLAMTGSKELVKNKFPLLYHSGTAR
jgi:hypothetical protein